MQRVQQESLMKQQEMRIASTRQEEFWWQSTAVVGAEAGAIEPDIGNEGRIAQA